MIAHMDPLSSHLSRDMQAPLPPSGLAPASDNKKTTCNQAVQARQFGKKRKAARHFNADCHRLFQRNCMPCAYKALADSCRTLCSCCMQLLHAAVACKAQTSGVVACSISLVASAGSTVLVVRQCDKARHSECTVAAYQKQALPSCARPSRWQVLFASSS